MKKFDPIRHLKKIVPFWQEITFAGLILTVVISNSIDLITDSRFLNEKLIGIGIFSAYTLCLIGQYFWRSRALAGVLAFTLALGSAYMMLACMSEINGLEAGDNASGLYFGMFLFLALIVTAVSMPFKYFSGRFTPKAVAEEYV